MSEEITLPGVVKWFSLEKGYGFITGYDDIDYYFNVKDVIGNRIPQTSELVEFCELKTPNGLRATRIRLSEGFRPVSDNTCSGCRRKIVPRIVFEKGKMDRSVCPFCGTTFKYFFETNVSSSSSRIFDGRGDIIGYLLLIFFIFYLYITW